MSQLVFKINEGHRVRPQGKGPETKPAYAYDACNACAYDLFFYFKGTLEFYLQILEILSILSHMEISHQIISGKRSAALLIIYKRKGA